VLGRDGGLPFPAASPAPANSAAPVYDAAVTALGRRAADPLTALVAIGLALLVVGCGLSTEASAPPTTSTGAGTSPSLTPVPGGPASAAASPSVPATTNVEGFGAIFDGLPPSFPQLPGQEPADVGTGPTSGSFAASTNPQAASEVIRRGLVAQGWSVDIGSPLEDGSIVLDATGPGVGCKTEVRLTPQSGSVIMSVLYGASCPFT
jgi:hypothetical protein